MSRGIDSRAVVERVGVGAELDAVVAAASAPRGDAAAGERGQRVDELVVLVVVDQIAALHYGVGAEGAHGVGHTRQYLGGQCLLWPERRLKR